MKIYGVVTTWMLLACSALAGCAKEDDRLPVSVTTAVTHDFNEGDALRTASHYTDDAQILPPRSPVIDGKPAIAAFFQANIDKYIGFGNVTQWSAVRGDIGIEQGVYTVRNVKIGQNVESGKYIRIWKRRNGTWKLYRDMFSPDSVLSQSVFVAPDEPAAAETLATK